MFKLDNIKIRTLIGYGFGILVVFLILLGTIAWRQTSNIWGQFEMIQDHPNIVRRTILEFEKNVLIIHRGMKDVVFSDNNSEIERILENIKISENEAFAKLKLIKERYLGNFDDITELENEFIKWNIIREETIRLKKEGNIEESINRTNPDSIGGLQASLLLKKTEKIFKFADNKAESFYSQAKENNKKLKIQLVITLSLLLLLSISIFYIITTAVRRPLRLLTQAIDDFNEGKQNVICSYNSNNEFGHLSSNFNIMSEILTKKEIIHKYSTHLSNVMLKESEPSAFCREVLLTLLEHTDSQMGAFYLIDKSRDKFIKFESVGLKNDSKSSYSLSELEGDIGSVAAGGKIRYLTIPEDSPFNFVNLSGEIKPKSIVSLPLHSSDEVVGVISIASINNFTDLSLEFLENISGTIEARLSGVISYQKIIAQSTELEYQNSELEAQKSELSAQTLELTEMNTELEQQKRQLDEANKLKSIFLSNMSHELRTPLNSVIALSDVLYRRLAGKVSEDEYEYIDVIGRNGKHLLMLINDILDISRIEAGKEEINLSRFSINKLSEQLITLIKPLATEKKIAISNEVSVNIPEIVSDYGKCVHILQNLVGNAVKFTDKGEVSINAKIINNEAYISVVDSGIGISEENLKHIFEEFRQADGSTSRKYGGTGLGLAIAKKYAELISGRIIVESTPSKGSVFTLILPLNLSNGNYRENSSEGYLDQKQSSFNNVIESNGEKILLVDDSEPALIQMSDILISNGYKVIIARNGNQAIEQVNKSIPDAIVLDLMMPEMDGFETLGIIRNESKSAHIPVLILTAKHLEKSELSFLKGNNIHQLIQKGDVSRIELLDAVSGLFNEKPNYKNSEVKEGPIRSIHSSAAKISVLIVEDNPDNMKTMKAILQDRCNITEAFSGSKAIILANTILPDLILMDLALPEVSGFDALKEIRKNDKLADVPVIAVTASVLKGDKEQIIRFGFDGYISKPVDQNLLWKMIEDFQAKNL